jgi:hypothetical protein
VTARRASEEFARKSGGRQYLLDEASRCGVKITSVALSRLKLPLHRAQFGIAAQQEIGNCFLRDDGPAPCTSHRQTRTQIASSYWRILFCFVAG